MQAMSCDYLPDLWASFEGDTPHNEELRDHLATCRTCQQEQAEMKRLGTLLRRADVPIDPERHELSKQRLLVACAADLQREPALAQVPGQWKRRFTRSFPLLIGSSLAGAVAAALVMLHPAPGPRLALLPPAPVSPPTLADVRPSLARASASSARLGTPFRAPGPLSGTALPSPPASRHIPSSTGSDMAYVNGMGSPVRPPVATARVAPSVGDDFITIPLPQIAAADPAVADRVAAEALGQYEKEKAVVDPRLAQKVSLQIQGGDLTDLMAALTRATGVRFYVSKDIRDLKLTVLVTQQPVRDIMRQVVRLFNLQWHRLGDAPKYEYSLVQTLKQKLAEEDLRRKDVDQIVLSATSQLEQYKPYLDAPSDQLHALSEQAKERARTAGTVDERDRALEQARMFEMLSHPIDMADFKVFLQLTPDQLVSLRNGDRIEIKYDATDKTLPRSVAELVQKEMGHEVPIDAAAYDKPVIMTHPDNGRTAADVPLDQIITSVSFSLDRSRPDRSDLVAENGCQVRLSDGRIFGPGLPETLVTGQPGAMAVPDNAQAHRDLESSPDFKATVSLDPKPNNPGKLSLYTPIGNELKMGFMMRAQSAWSTAEMAQPDIMDGREWIDSADFFATLHQKTGKNIIADYYLQLYPRRDFVADEPLIRMLNNAADEMKSNWQQDGQFLRFRRINYYSQRAVDVPNRLLRKWRQDHEANGMATLADLGEMATMPDAVLDAPDFAQAVLIKWKLDDWMLARHCRWILRPFGKLSPFHQQQAQSDTGLALSDCTPEELAAFNGDGETAPETLAKRRYFIRLRAPGYYVWTYGFDDRRATNRIMFPGHDDVRETTKEKAQAAVRAIMQARGASEADIKMQGTYLVRGPGAGVWMCYQDHDGYHMYENHLYGD